MALEILVNTGSGNGLLPDSTKPLPEPMSTYHQWDPLAFIPVESLLEYSILQPPSCVWNLLIWNHSHSPRGQWIKAYNGICGTGIQGISRHGINPVFYPRPVLAFRYCHRLRLCACPCVCVSVCVNHLLVHAITRDLFKLGSPNLDHRCKRPWLRSLLFWGVIDHDLQGQNLPHFELVRTNSLPIQARITKFGPEVENNLVKIPIVLGGNWPWPSRSNLIWNVKFSGLTTTGNT